MWDGLPCARNRGGGEGCQVCEGWWGGHGRESGKPLELLLAEEKDDRVENIAICGYDIRHLLQLINSRNRLNG